MSASGLERMIEDRGLPADIEAEKAILGAVLLNNDLLAEVEGLLQVSDFYLNSHRHILDSMMNLGRQGMAIDPVTLGADLRVRGCFKQVGGVTYLASLIDGVPRMDTIVFYARIVKRKTTWRRRVALVNTLSIAVAEEDDEAFVASVERISDMGESANGWRGVYPSLDEFFSADLPDPEPILFGLHRGEVAGLFAITNHGKSTVLLNVALSVTAGQVCLPLAPIVSKPLHIVYVDCESPAARLRADVQKMRGNITNSHTANKNFFTLVDAARNDRPLNLSKPDHLKYIITLAKAFGADLVIIDTAASAFELQEENNNAEVTRHVMNPLKRLAREVNCAVIFSHHIGKANETQTGEGAYRGRGASAFGALSRTVFTLERDAKKGPGYVVLSCAKIKGQSFEPTLMKLNHETRWFELCDEKPEVKSQLPTAQEITDFVAEQGKARTTDIKKHFAGRGAERTISDRIAEAERLGLIEKINQQAPWRVCNSGNGHSEVVSQTAEESTISESVQVCSSYKELHTALSTSNGGPSAGSVSCSICGVVGLLNTYCDRCGEFLR